MHGALSNDALGNEIDLYLFNARNLVTRWGPKVTHSPHAHSHSHTLTHAHTHTLTHSDGKGAHLLTHSHTQGQISDYSSRLWSGLIKSYYRERWRIFFDGVLSFHDYEKELARFEEGWQHLGDKGVEPSTEHPVTESLRIFERYHIDVSDTCGEI